MAGGSDMEVEAVRWAKGTSGWGRLMLVVAREAGW